LQFALETALSKALPKIHDNRRSTGAKIDSHTDLFAAFVWRLLLSEHRVIKLNQICVWVLIHVSTSLLCLLSFVNTTPWHFNFSTCCSIVTL